MLLGAQRAAQLVRCAARIGRLGDGPHDRDTTRAGGADGTDVVGGDATDGEERHGRVVHGVAHELKADRWAAGLRRGRVDRSHTDVVRARGRSRVDLGRGVRGESDDRLGAEEVAGSRHGHVVLAEVDAVGPGSLDEIWTVVEDEEGVVGRAQPPEPVRGGQDGLIGGGLAAQLDDIDPTVQGGCQHAVLDRAADEVEARLLEPLLTLVHSPSLAGAPR